MPPGPLPRPPQTIDLYAKLTPMQNGSFMVSVPGPPANLWHQAALFMEVVGTLSYNTIGQNPVGINDAEAMADYVAEYITRVIMGAHRG